MLTRSVSCDEKKLWINFFLEGPFERRMFTEFCDSTTPVLRYRYHIKVYLFVFISEGGVVRLSPFVSNF